MQKLISNLFKSILLVIISLPSYAQNQEVLLQNADSLFEQKRFTQSLKLYDSLLSENKYTPSMLLKMSFITEGLGNYSESLYYLNLYYLVTTDEDALTKMEELGNEHQLIGYEATEKDLAYTYYYRYFPQIIFILSGICLILVSIAFFIRYKTERTPYWAAIGFVAAAALLFYFVNFGRSYNQGILTSPVSYLMSDASSGSSLVTVVKQGHKVNIIDQEDVWVKILWKDTPLYVRENHIKPIEIY